MSMALADDEYWEWFDEIDDFRHQLRHEGCVIWPESGESERAYDDSIFARAVAETPLGAQWFEEAISRSRGPGRRMRDRYWDRRQRGK